MTATLPNMTFTALPTFLDGEMFKHISVTAKNVIARLLNRHKLSEQNPDRFSRNGKAFVYYKRSELANEIGVNRKTISYAIKQLEDAGLLSDKRQGQGKPNRITIIAENINKLVDITNSSYTAASTSTSAAPATPAAPTPAACAAIQSHVEVTPVGVPLVPMQQTTAQQVPTSELATAAAIAVNGNNIDIPATNGSITLSVGGITLTISINSGTPQIALTSNAEVQKSDCEVRHIKKSHECTSRSPISGHQEVQKVPHIERLKEKNQLNYENQSVRRAESESYPQAPVHKSVQNQTDRLTTETVNAIKEQIDYDYYLDNFRGNIGFIDTMIGYIAEMKTFNSTKINGIDVPKSELIQLFDKMDDTVFIDFLPHFTSKSLVGVNNKKAYIKTMFVEFLREEAAILTQVFTAKKQFR